MGTCTNRRGLTRQVLEALVLDTLKQHLMHPDLVEEFISAFTLEVNRQCREQDAVVEQKRLGDRSSVRRQAA
jgi:site-specific DNA recombinase